MSSRLGTNRFFIEVNQPDSSDLLDSQATSNNVQVEVKIVFKLYETCIECSHNGRASVSDSVVKSRKERSCTFDLINFSKQVQTCYKTLLENLTALEIHKDLIDFTIGKIISRGSQIIDENRESNRGRRVIPLQAKLTRVQYVVKHYERYMMHRAVRESMEEFERRNSGRVPASESSVKTLLKRVRVEATGDDQEKQESKRRRLSESERQIMNCSICLEQLWVGSYGMAMPCSHVFHGDCIIKWLKQSHHCPLCRYEMPTDH